MNVWVDWGKGEPDLACRWDSGYQCNANCTTTNGVCGIAFIDCLEIVISEIVSVCETQLSWKVRVAGVMVQWLQMSFHLQHLAHILILLDVLVSITQLYV